jgi:imidazolonepropionase-like amidohydrolase
MASGGVLSTYTSPDYPQFNSKELATIVNEAKANGLNVVAHCHSLKGMNNCIKAGVKSIEHGTFIDRKTAQSIAKKRIYLTPTLVVHHTLIEEGFPSWDNFAKERLKKLEEVVKIQKENISIAYEEGVRFLMGSDCGVIDHGRNLGELKYLVDIGMEPIEAIEAGTIRGARFFKQDDRLGSIEEGKLADLIMVKGNPVDDISILADNDNIKKVVLDGKLVKDKLI